MISNKAKPEQSLTKKGFLTQLARVKREVLELTEGELDNLINDPARLRAYNKVKWYLATVSVKEVGVWREAGGLPLNWTKKDLEDTSEKVFKAIEENDNRVSVRKRVGFAVRGILQEEDVIEKEKYLYPIVLPGGTAGREGLEKLQGDIDDGNMRSIAFAGDGEERLTVYVGMRTRDLLAYRIKAVLV